MSLFANAERYAAMALINKEEGNESDLGGFHEALAPVMQTLEEATGLFQSESMHVSNDPRFFQSSVLSKRLSAFAGLSVVSGLMTGTASDVISMKKDINLETFEGMLQMVSFSIMSAVLFANIMATYVGVAQIYHAIRLETAGPTGFEMAVSYYLNPNIVAWRHLAVKCMVVSLPMFMISTGIRLQVNFSRVAAEPALPSTHMARMLGFTFMGFYVAAALVVSYVHYKHVAIFRERYELVKQMEQPHLNHIKTMMTKRSNRNLDV